MPLPLEGIRVIDVTIWQQGPYAGALLADLGADVIKVEEVRHGDPGRGAWLAPDLGLSSYFEAHNRGKRSVAIDLKSADGLAALMRVVEKADIFLTNYREDAMRRLGAGYEAVAAVNPRIVYVQASGYGPSGDDASLGAFDYLAQARSGFASTNGETDDPPLPATVPIADQSGALHACIAALAGLASRNATGRGARYDTSLLGSMVSMQAFDINWHLFTGALRERPMRGGSRPFWRLYKGGDGKWFVIGMLLDRAWADVCGVIGRPELAEDERFRSYRGRIADNASALIEILDEVFATAPARHWIDGLNAVGMFSAPVQDHAELATDGQVTTNAYVHEVERPGAEPVRMAGSGIAMDGEPIRIRRLAPQLGEHTEDVLLEAGYTWEEIVGLREARVIGPLER